MSPDDRAELFDELIAGVVKRLLGSTQLRRMAGDSDAGIEGNS